MRARATFSAIVFLVCSVGVALAATPKQVPADGSREQVVVTIQKIVDQLGLENAKLQAKVDETMGQKEKLQTAFNTQVSDISKLQSWGDEGWKKYVDAEKAHAKQLKKYFALKCAAVAFAVLLVGLFTLQFTAALPPPYSFGTPVAIGSIVGAGLWLFL